MLIQLRKHVEKREEDIYEQEVDKLQENVNIWNSIK